MSLREAEDMIEWELWEIGKTEQHRLQELVRTMINKVERSEYDRRVKDYVFCMAHFPMLARFGEAYDVSEPATNAYFQKATQRVFWQVAQLHVFVGVCLVHTGGILRNEPVKTQSSHYEETLKVERPQHDLVTDMVLELSRLPRFNAYAKLIDESEGRQVVRTHRIQTHPLPDIQNLDMVAQAIRIGHRLCKERDEIEAEIRERQARWLRSATTPTTRGL
jgi:hypothetical protein